MFVNREIEFPQRMTKFLQRRLEELKTQYGEDSPEYRSLSLQYIYDAHEDNPTVEHNAKHYEAGVQVEGGKNVERLYEHHCCIEMAFNCLSNCRYCLRSNYDRFTLTEEQMDANAAYLRSIEAEEVLLTGGDPLLNLRRLRIFTDKIVDTVPTIRIIRIATRVFTQDPAVMSDDTITFLKKLKERVRVEVATQINSAVELQCPDVRQAFEKVLALGIPVYSQNVFLKGINDTPEQLIDLYHEMRLIGIEAHYLFHCIPMRGIHHLRPSVDRMIMCYEALVNAGHITGRCKPILAIMSQIGKITLTPNNYQIKTELPPPCGYVALRSNYKYEDRLAYNPNWKLPDDAFVDNEGYLCIYYLDGED